jgi:hypothetical protein
MLNIFVSNSGHSSNAHIQKGVSMNTLRILLSLFFTTAFISPSWVQAQGEAANPTEFTLTDFTDATRGWSFKRPTSWTQDSGFKDGIRFAGGDEWLTLQIMDSKQTPKQFTSSFAVPNGETKTGIKPFKQGKFSASVFSSGSVGKSSVTGKPTDLLTDRWVFAPKLGKLAILTVTGPKKVFDWEGNRDMALSVWVK